MLAAPAEMRSARKLPKTTRLSRTGQKVIAAAEVNNKDTKAQRGRAATQDLEKADYDYEDEDEDENLRRLRNFAQIVVQSAMRLPGVLTREARFST